MRPILFRIKRNRLLTLRERFVVFALLVQLERRPQKFRSLPGRLLPRLCRGKTKEEDQCEEACKWALKVIHAHFSITKIGQLSNEASS
jgi:hypothetical protein